MNVSFVIRTYNEEKYIEEVIKKIKAQATNHDIEIIIVDSESTDGTVEISRKLGAKIVHITKSEWSWGRSLNKGIEASNSDYIAIISGHCILASDQWVETSIHTIQEGYDAIYGRQIPIKGLDYFEEYELFKWYPDIDLCKLSIKNQTGISNAACFMKREAWNQVKFDEEAQSMEDGIWATTAIKLGLRVGYTSRTCLYHSHPFDAEYTYRKWYSRTLAGLRYADILFSGNKIYKTKRLIKRHLFILIIIKNSLLELIDFQYFFKENKAVSFKAACYFILLKYYAIIKSQQSYNKNINVKYWGVQQSNRLMTNISNNLNGMFQKK
ncbi:hypothetical protein C6P61_10575 [Malikia spinosa]|uniref:Glycosyltransferase 2-like domain-containing protein n=1 Tax=Malikia spinosa TaxID=86180 RepID=A0A2S9KDQ3_9BURK|nr:glycosyltransferase [Malikia spinosa]PRD68573.1 hypothetical protein C6P61_10575 [Malikia spinosa]